MASRQEKYFKNYRFEQIPDHSKKGYKNVYTYIGDYYTWKLSDSELSSKRHLFGICEIASLLIFFSTGMVRSPLNLKISIIFPSILALVTLIFEVFAMWIFCFGKSPYREEDYKRMDQTFRLTFILRFLFLAVSFILSAIYTIRLRLGATGFTVAGGYLICSLIALFLWKVYDKMKDAEKIILSENR